MTLVVEDGTGLTFAESYCTVPYADDYHRVRSNIAWEDGTIVDDKEAALRAATQYIESAYWQKWAGLVAVSGQMLSWPRGYVPLPQSNTGYPYMACYLPTVIPTLLQNACCELALRSLNGPLMPDLERLKQSITVGPIRTDYVKGASAATRYRMIDNMLAPLLRLSGSSMQIVRA